MFVRGGRGVIISVLSNDEMRVGSCRTHYIGKEEETYVV